MSSTNLIYFAWVRERIGKGEEVLDLPPYVTTVHDLLAYLPSLGEGYAEALQQPDMIRVALDQEHSEHDAELAGVREIAIFPPMTGG
ncbi:molybdopterin converting factor subunit 1 [Rhizobium sp. CFBP 8762]|uniref:molybdopterin converting factor subunit 1 n=1 Tax=Rhizobium sp. CFBP 8762 TaxID=2775279 RepID=UPI00177CBE2C|nr:molybdopterin converting factor subunit 1 [Rhizobium sp. CFBP 8762]MBD8553043.1 molybdopterin converting factor subunit 1 [Rhizobium sp. CFBP 8762]